MAKLTVSKIHGEVLATSRDGTQRTLKLGDVVLEGEAITTKDGSTVSFVGDSTTTIILTENQYMVLSSEVFSSNTPTSRDSAITGGTSQQVIKAIVSGQDLNVELEATAAGLGGAAEGDGSTFVMLSRILEQVNGNTYDYRFKPVSSEYLESDFAIASDITETPGDQVVPTPPPTDPQVPIAPSNPEVSPTPSNPTVPPSVEDPKLPEDPKDPTPPDENPGDPEVPPTPEEPGDGGTGDEEGDDNEKPPVVPPVEPPLPPSDPTHANNGWGNGDQTAPGNSGNNNNAENNTSGTTDPSHGNNAGGNTVPPVVDPIPPLLPPEDLPVPPVDHTPGNSGQNNGWGNGDQTAPGNSGPNNNAENSDATNPLLKDTGRPDTVPAESSLHTNDLLDSLPVVGDNTQIPNYSGLLLDLQMKPNQHE